MQWKWSKIVFLQTDRLTDQPTNGQPTNDQPTNQFTDQTMDKEITLQS